jgi:hypothetical protein
MALVMTMTQMRWGSARQQTECGIRDGIRRIVDGMYESFLERYTG